MQPTQGYASGAITTQNLNPNSGVPTPGSFVMLPLTGNYDTLAMQIVGTWGAQPLSLQGTVDGVNWITFGGSQAMANLNTGAQSANVAAGTQGMFQSDVASFQGVRLTQLASGMTGTANVALAGTASNGMTGIDTPVIIGGGSNAIGTILPGVGSGHTLTAAASTNATSVKPSSAQLCELTVDNFTAALKYLKLYNKASAPTVGTDVPVWTIPIPINGQFNAEFGQVGKRFTTGLAYALTGAQAVADTTALAAGDVHVALTYL